MSSIALTPDEAAKVEKAKALVTDHDEAKKATNKIIAQISNPAVRGAYVSKIDKARKESDGVVANLTRRFAEAWAEMTNSGGLQKAFTATPAASTSKPSALVPRGNVGGLLGFETPYEGHQGMGFVMFVPIAIKVTLVAAAAAVAYAAVTYTRAIALEKEVQAEVLRDPSVSAADKLKAATTFISAGGAGMNAGIGLAVGVGLLGVAFLLFRSRAAAAIGAARALT